MPSSCPSSRLSRCVGHQVRKGRAADRQRSQVPFVARRAQGFQVMRGRHPARAQAHEVEQERGGILRLPFLVDSRPRQDQVLASRLRQGAQEPGLAKGVPGGAGQGRRQIQEMIQAVLLVVEEQGVLGHGRRKGRAIQALDADGAEDPGPSRRVQSPHEDRSLAEGGLVDAFLRQALLHEAAEGGGGPGVPRSARP